MRLIEKTTEMKKINEAIETGRHIGRLLATDEPLDSPVIEKWRDENAEANAMLDSFAESGGMQRKLAAYRSRDSMAGYRRFRNNVSKRRRTLRIGAVAAIALLIVAAGALLTLHLGDSHAVNTQPGSAYAYLIGGDGETIDLGSPLSIESGGVNILNNPQGTIRYEADATDVADAVYNTIVVPRRGEYQITLSDNTRVWLNSESRLSFQVAFTGTVRSVTLEGEAYFEVAHDNRPFVVSMEGMEVEVLGTSFNIMSYVDDDIQQVTLAEGSVRVRTGDDEKELAPGQQATFDRNDNTLHVGTVNAELYTAWKNGEFVFNNENLESVLSKLSRWFDVEFMIHSDAIRSLVFTGSLRRYTTLNEICDILSRSNSIKFVFTDKIEVMEQ